MLQAVSQVDHNADNSPDGESNPGQPWEKAHEAEAGQHAKNGNDWHEGKPEWAMLIGFYVAQNHDADTNQDKSKESADICHVRGIADGNQSGKRSHPNAGKNSGIVRRALAGMHG